MKTGQPVLESFGNKMISFYRIVLAICIVPLVFGFLVCFAIPLDESFASQLERNPAAWQIHIDQMHQAWIGRDDNRAKELLLKFLQQNHVPTYKKLGYTATGLTIVAIFAGIGLYREKYYQRRLHAEPPAPASEPRR
jgi:hypothetical protein